MVVAPSEYRLSIVVPVYNEREHLPTMLARLLRVIPAKESEIIVVDDGSTDGTRDWLSQLAQSVSESGLVVVSDDGRIVGATNDAPPASNTRLRIQFQPTNAGKGAAVRTGLGLAQYEVLVVQDADLEYDPADLKEMFGLMTADLADVVYGTRFSSRPHRSLYLHHRLANWLISAMVDVLCNATLSDVEVCYKMFRREVLDGMRLTCNDFGFEVEFTIKMLMAKHWRLYEAGISYYGRTYAEGKKINWRDGILALWYVFRFRFGR